MPIPKVFQVQFGLSDVKITLVLERTKLSQVILHLMIKNILNVGAQSQECSRHYGRLMVTT